MSVGWSGPDPVGFADGTSANYELGTQYTANGNITITHIRVWGHPSGAVRTSRVGRIWTSAGAELELVTMADTLPSGWSVYALVTPLQISSGTQFVVSYSVTNRYGALTPSPGYPRVSSDGLLTATTGRLTTNPPVFPTTLSATAFYGIDVQYNLTVGNVAPVITALTASPAGMDVTTSWQVTDETPGSVTYLVEWGDGTTTNTSALTATHTYANTGTYAVMVTATDSGGLKDSAAAFARIVGQPSAELLINRLNIKAFIDARPIQLELIPVINVRTESGGRRAEDGPKRVADVFRLIEQVSAYGNSPGLLPTQDGQQRRVTYQLLGEWDCIMQVGDHWIDTSGVRYEVRELLPYNGYERRGRVVQYG